MVEAKELLTVLHHFFTKVNSETKLLFVGEHTMAVTHRCTRMHEEKVLKFEQPTYFARPAIWCSYCNTLFFARDDKKPIEKDLVASAR